MPSGDNGSIDRGDNAESPTMHIRIALFALALATPVTAADFSGTWSLDNARSKGLPPGLEQSVTVEQLDNTLNVTTALISDGGDRIIHDVYALTGVEADFDPQYPGITAKSAKRTARRTGDRSFEATDHIEGTGMSGPVTMDITRKWQLAEDASTLTIDQSVTTSGYTTSTTRVLIRGAGAAPGGPIASRMFPIDLQVPLPPAAFRSGGKTNLVYEVHATSFRGGDVDWQRLDVIDDRGNQLASYAGADLEAMLTRAGTPGRKDIRRIAGGGRDVAFIWLTLDGAPPATLHHRAVFSLSASANHSERLVEGADTPVANDVIVLGPPVRGGDWIARWVGPTSFHRRGLMVIDGGAHIAQRFAIDWNRIGPDHREWHGDGKKNEDYSVYGQDVIAVSDGVIGRVVDSLPANVPGSMNPAVTLTADTAAGNSISLRLPNNTYAVYAHLQPGSIRVKEGQRVKRGDILGLVGNSGNATGPHLHFHVSTGPMLQGEGVPYVFESFRVVGHEDGDQKDDGTFNGTTSAGELRRKEFPTEHMLVRFD